MTGEEVEEGRYKRGEEGYEEMVGKVWELADGLCVCLFLFLSPLFVGTASTLTRSTNCLTYRLDIVRAHTPDDRRMAEQFDKQTGEGRGARDLTWCVLLRGTFPYSSLLLKSTHGWPTVISRAQELRRPPDRHPSPLFRPFCPAQLLLLLFLFLLSPFRRGGLGRTRLPDERGVQRNDEGFVRGRGEDGVGRSASFLPLFLALPPSLSRSDPGA